MKHWPPVNMEKRKARSPDRGSLLLQEPLSMNEQATLFLMEVLNGFEEPPRSDWPRHEAEEVSFSRWAVEELLQQVWDHPWTLASETAERFAAKLGLYAETCVTDQQHRIFRIAAETVRGFLDEIEKLER